MIRAEIVVNEMSYRYDKERLERKIKKAIVAAVLSSCEPTEADITRVQFFGPKKRT